jgi:hypothetical protein
MSKSRKTVDVAYLLDTVNHALANSVECYDERRSGMISLLESALHESGNYKGYRYLHEDEIPSGGKPGIRVDANGENLPYPDRFVDTDDTRRSYYI